MSLSAHVERLRTALARFDELDAALHSAATAVAASLGAGGKLLAAGNGGSAAEAQHLTSELTGRLHADRERPALAAVALHVDSSTITALGNDYGFDQIFARQVEGVGRAGDVLVVLSTSGRSPNLVAAVETAIRLDMVTVGLLGSGPSPLHERCRFTLCAPTDDQQATQECHLVLVHVLVELVEDLLAR